MAEGGKEEVRAETTRSLRPPNSAASKNGCANSSGCWAASSLAAGQDMRVSSAMFLELRDGRIVAQRNYDCFEPF